ncbi:MAG: cytochrome c biogenesis protein CcdA [Cyclobacteriaceae bacterium]
MRKFLFLFILTLPIIGFSQILKPISWTVELSKEGPVVGDEVEIQFNAIIDAKWYLYSSDFDPDLGPMVTEFFFEENDTYELLGEIVPVNPKKKFDSLWMGDYTYFSGKGQFTQKVKILSEAFRIEGSYTYQVCSDIDGKCIPFDDDFSLGVKKKSTSEAVEEEPKVSEGLLRQRESTDPYSLLSFMVVAFLAGLAALLTPCVFPMIPMTVTFFAGKDNQKKGRVRNSLIYGVSIILIYTFIGSIIAPFMGPETANDLATGWIPNVIFFLVFLIFALSFLGLFEITLPNSFVNKVDAMGDKGGLIGVFFMALTLVLVSFSCTGPLVGSILVESAGGMVIKPIMGMLAFSAAFAIPFTLFALFPGWLSTLPKSGGWLNSVKVVLGFLELAFAFKFLSIADQAYHWNILDREVYLAIWIVIFTLLGFYLLGKLKLPGDDEGTKTSVPKLVLAIISFSFVTYMIPGMIGAPLNSLAGYLPPLTTHDFNLNKIIRDNSNADQVSEICEDPLYADFLHLPHGLQGYFDFNQALNCAKEQGKPIFIDFTGHGCVNCREMEQRVWADPRVLSRLNENFVVVALYVDDKTQLPEKDWYRSSYDEKLKKTIGKQNADFQITKFNNNAQPFYVILNEQEELLMAPTAYDLNVPRFVDFLDQALKNHRKNAALQLD